MRTQPFRRRIKVAALRPYATRFRRRSIATQTFLLALGLAALAMALDRSVLGAVGFAIVAGSLCPAAYSVVDEFLDVKDPSTP